MDENLQMAHIKP